MDEPGPEFQLPSDSPREKPESSVPTMEIANPVNEEKQEAKNNAGGPDAKESGEDEYADDQ